MDQKICGTCKKFKQHYIKFKREYLEVPCGHCIHPNIKHCIANSPACGDHEECQTDRRKFKKVYDDI